MYFYHQSLEHLHHIHSYLPPNSYPNSASSRTKRFRSSPDYTLSSLRNRCRFSQTFRDKSMPARVWNWRWTFARIRRTSDGVGARKFRLKRSCAGKHVSLRRRRCRSSPRGNVVVERRSTIKHVLHICYLRRVPFRNVTIECTFTPKASEHSSIRSVHIRHQTRIPIWHRPVIITRRPHSALAGDFGPCFR